MSTSLYGAHVHRFPLQSPKSTKKTDAPTADDKSKTETAPVAPAGGEQKETPVKKRK